MLVQPSTSFLACFLEDQLRPELDNSRVESCCDLSEEAARNVRTGVGELGMVKNVKEFCPELHFEPLPDKWSHLREREIQIPTTWPTESVPRERAISSQSGIGDRCGGTRESRTCYGARTKPEISSSRPTRTRIR